MPPAVGGAVLGGLSSFAFGISALGIEALTFEAFLIGFAVSLVIGLISSALAPEPPDFGGFGQDAEGRTRQIRQPIVERRIIYGEVRVSGPMVYVSTSNDDKDFHVIIALAGHEISSIDEVWLEDYVIYNDMLDSDGNYNITTGRYYRDDGKKSERGPLVRIKKHLGSPNQVADADLVSEVSDWTSNHRLQGIPYIYVRLRFDRDAFPSSIPNISAIIKGKPLFDTRDSSVRFSSNSSMAVYDYLIDDLGIRADSTEISSSFSSSASNTCDEFVTVTTESVSVGTGDTTVDTLEVTSTDESLLVQIGDRVDLTTSGTLPTPLVVGTNYYYVPYRRTLTDDGGAILVQLASTYEGAERSNEKSILLDGTDSYIDCSTASETAFDATTDPFSLECWMKSTNVPAGTEVFMSRRDTGESNAPGWTLFTDANDQLNFAIYDSSGNTLHVRSTDTITDGTWHHVGSTYDGSTNASGVSLYIDGASVATTTVTDTLTGTALPASVRLLFGAEDNAGAATSFFDGQIAEPRIWSTQRTSTEISTNYDLGIDPTATGLVGYWRLNENFGAIVADQVVSSGNDGTLTGSASWDSSRHVIELTSAGSGTHTLRKIAEPRYTATGVIETDKRPVAILEEILTSMGGRLVFAGGSWRTHAAVFATPTIQLDESHILEGKSIGMRTKQSRKDRFNAVKGVYISPINMWQPSDYPPVTNATYQTEDNGIQLFQEHNLPFTNRPHTAQRLAKIRLERHRQQITLNYPCNLHGFQVQAGDFIEINNTRFGWSEKVFEVLGWELTAEEKDDTMIFGVNMELQESASGVFDWNNGEETMVDLAPNTTLPNIWTVSQPTGVSVASEVEGTAAGDDVVKLKVFWNSPASAFVTQDGLIEIQFRRASGNALNFVASETDYVDIGDVTEISYDATNPFSIEYQFSHTTAPGSAQTVVSRQDSGESGSPGWAITVDTSGFHRFNLIHTAATTAGSDELIVRNQANLGDSSFHHVAWTYNGSKSSTGVHVYVDGSTVATSAVSDTLTGAASPADSRLLIGARDINSTGQDQYLDGTLDEIRIWSDVRSSTEISENSTAEITGTESNLDGYWRFDEIVGSTSARDRSPSGNDGTLIGAPEYVTGAMDPAWEPSFFVTGEQTETFIGPVSNGVLYDVRVRSVSHLGVRSDWVTLSDIVAGGDTIGVDTAKDYGLITEAVNKSLDYDLITASVTTSADYSGI